MELRKIPDDDFLSAMPHLRKLDITVAQLGAKPDFLNDCKELRVLYLRGGGFSQLTEIPDLELLPNAQFIVFYNNTVRCEP